MELIDEGRRNGKMNVLLIQREECAVNLAARLGVERLLTIRTAHERAGRVDEVFLKPDFLIQQTIEIGVFEKSPDSSGAVVRGRARRKKCDGRKRYGLQRGADSIPCHCRPHECKT